MVSLGVSACLLWFVSSGLAKSVVNVALKKRCGQSSYHTSYRSASLAVNNNTGGRLDTNNCIHKQPGDRNPTWYVDLGKVYPVWEVVIYGRTDYLHRMVDVFVQVDQLECARITSEPTVDRIPLTCKETTYGQNITIEKQYSQTRSDEENVLNICEVQIWVCDPGYYGDRCDQPCGKCNDTVCGRKDGKCRFLPCLPGYSSDTCQKCVVNMFGENCASRCGKCQGDATCDQVTGNCPHGCAAGWTGSMCEKECAAYTFGDTCNSVCGKCVNNVTCHHVTGDCRMGCAGGWTGSRCKNECRTHMFGENCETTCGNCKDNVTCHHVTGECSLGCAEGWTGHQCDQAQDALDTKLVPGASAGVVLGVIAAVVMCFVIIKRRRATSLSKDNLSGIDSRQQAQQTENAYTREQCVQNSRSSGEWLETGQRWPQQAADESEAHWERLEMLILDKLQSGDLETDFSKLTRGMVYACADATMRKNRRKNRFKDILPYDRTRVVLETDDDQECSDYINASYLQGFSTDKAYIAAQGPIQNAADDFWRMVWQKNVTQIIMLTKMVTKQGDKSEFFKYWPSAGEKQRHGQVEVSNVDEVSKAHFVVRTFSVKKDNEFRHVDHFQFTGFTEQETHSTVPFVQFWRFVTSRRLRNLQSPPVIHCSAGVGQTGVYIALDVIMKRLQFETAVSIFDVVSRMRQDRCNMVNHQDYYRDLHTAVLEACVSRNTCLDMEMFERVFSEPVDVCRPNNVIDWQCQILQIMPGVLLNEYYASVYELEDETNMKCITTRVAGRHLSIKAVFVPTLLDAHGIIVTPFPDSVEAVWSLIESYRFGEIVSLRNVQEQPADLYWPTQTGSELGAGIYTVALSSKTDLGECLTSYNLTWQRRRESGQVRLLHYCCWQEDLPDNTQELVYLLSLLAKTLHDKEHAPLLVQCFGNRDGLVRCGMFCVLCHLMSQIAVDGSIDVFSAVRHVQGVMPEFVMSTEQYRFCYHVAQQLRHSDDIYVNLRT